MNIALIGYGKMGQAIEKIAIARGHKISARIDANPADWNVVHASNTDVAIEFSVPDKAVENIKRCIELGIPVLSGTTGWLADKPIVDQMSVRERVPFFYASNYSLGVNLFFKLNEYLANLIKAYPQYQVSMEEIHHTQKKDAPSGTAITLAEGILKNSQHKTGWAPAGEEKENELPITSKRIDPYPGQHSVTYHSTVDDIEIRHTAHSREGFALGAVLVAEWLPTQKGVVGMDDYLKITL